MPSQSVDESQPEPNSVGEAQAKFEDFDNPDAVSKELEEHGSTRMVGVTCVVVPPGPIGPTLPGEELPASVALPPFLHDVPEEPGLAVGDEFSISNITTGGRLRRYLLWKIPVSKEE